MTNLSSQTGRWLCSAFLVMFGCSIDPSTTFGVDPIKDGGTIGESGGARDISANQNLSRLRINSGHIIASGDAATILKVSKKGEDGKIRFVAECQGKANVDAVLVIIIAFVRDSGPPGQLLVVGKRTKINSGELQTLLAEVDEVAARGEKGILSAILLPFAQDTLGTLAQKETSLGASNIYQLEFRHN